MNRYDVEALGELLVDFTEEGLSTQGINTDNLIEDPEVPTTLAFVHTKADGDRSLSFYRNPGADMMLRWEDIHPEILENTRIFHLIRICVRHYGEV